MTKHRMSYKKSIPHSATWEGLVDSVRNKRDYENVKTQIKAAKNLPLSTKSMYFRLLKRKHK